MYASGDRQQRSRESHQRNPAVTNPPPGADAECEHSQNRHAAVPDPRFAHTLVINYASLSQSDLEEALQLLTDVLLPLLA